MTIEEIKFINQNPFFSSKILVHFLSGCSNHSVKFELLFFVLPILSNQEVVDSLQKAKSTSTIDTIFSDSNAPGKNASLNLTNKYQYFKHLTQKALVVTSNEYKVVIGDYITLESKIDYKNIKNDYAKTYFKAAYYLGMILSKEDHIKSMVKLGIKEL